MRGAPDQTLIDILRVDHAGEYGAIRIDGAQIAIARRVAPDLVSLLEHALGDERRHCATFAANLAERSVRPCDMLPLWGIGGTFLGAITSLFGHDAILVCTEAVERTVHRHMDEQVAWLATRDPILSQTIAAIRDEEIAHLDGAVTARRAASGIFLRMLDAIVAAATEALVWLSTYGVSSRMRARITHDDR
jgi:ubiquinone biosynthesis monooxygenase Coq7